MFKFRADRGVEHEVDGQTVHFYMLPATALLQFRAFAPSLAKAISTLCQPKDNDSGAVRKEAVGPDGFKTTSYESMAIDVDVLSARTKEASDAWVGIVNTLTDKDTLHAVIRLALYSMRDDVQAADIEKPGFVEEKAREIDLETLVQILQGTFKANRKLFDPFLEALPKNVLKFGRVAPEAGAEAEAAAPSESNPESPGSSSSTTSTEG